MKKSHLLRVFRKEQSGTVNQTSILRFVRTTPKSDSENKSIDSSSDIPASSSVINGSSSSPNQLNESPPAIANGSKLFYVNPLTAEELEEKKKKVDAVDCGINVIPLIKSTSDNLLNGSSSHSQEVCNGFSNDIEMDNKRSRIVSDEECDDELGGTSVKRICISDDDEEDEEDDDASSHHSSKEAIHSKFTPEVIEKLLDTYCDMYPRLEKMEIYETMLELEFNFFEMTKKLDSRSQEEKRKQKIQNKALIAEEKKNLINQKKQLIKNRVKEEVKKKRAAWKLKGKLHEMDEDDEDSEDYIGKNNVYDSDSSEDEESVSAETLAPARRMVLDFFNDSSLSELSFVPGCSRKKAEVIIQCRPFENWLDLVYKMKTERNVSTDLLNSAKDVLQMRSAIKNLMKKCERISSEIQKCVSQLIVDDTSAMIRQPTALNNNFQLKHYQLIGLNWLALMHEQDLNGVLADEMGLGKTIQAIAFLSFLMEKGELEERFCLIVVPSSTLDNWARELRTWCPALKFFTYHGSQEERRGMRLALINSELEEDIFVILTTYTMISNNPEDRALFKRISLHTVVFDEAHMLKNMTSLRYENLMKIKCKRRVLLTGTPLQNNLVELMSILVFVMPQLFEGKKNELKKVFSMFPKSESDQDKSTYERGRIEQAKRIMGPFFLRRLKEDVLKDLPAKTEEILRTPMNELQSQLYKSTVRTLSRRSEQIKEELEKTKLKNLEEVDELIVSSNEGKSSSKAQRVEDSALNMLMKLRKTANHSLLIRNIYTDAKLKEMAHILKRTTHTDSVLQYIIEDFAVMSDFEIHTYCTSSKPLSHFQLSDDQIVSSGKMEKLDEILPKMKESGDRVLLFSQFVIVLDLLEAYVKIRGYEYRRLDGSTQVTERQEMIDDFNEDENIFIFLLSTRAGGLGINLSSANTVILHDIDFNPYNDRQAEDRCHRVGQTRTVNVYRLISAHSIEEGIYQIAQNKLKLEKDITEKADDQCKADVVTLLKTALQED